MSTVRVYRNTDPGAPPHPSATRGSMAALLRACLVTGYGSGENFKAPAGWEEPFAESGNYAVFRALQGARQFYQINDSTANTNITIMSGFEAMSGVTTGTGQWGEKYFGKTVSTGGPPSNWIVIADQRTSYVFLDTTRGLTGHMIGEYSSFYEDDPYNSLIAGHPQSTGLYSLASTNVNTNGAVLFASHGRDVGTTFVTTLTTLGEGPSHNKRGIRPASPHGKLNNGYFSDAVATPQEPGKKYPVVPVNLISGSTGFLCGRFRGVLAPLMHRPKPHNVPFEHDGKTILPLDLGYGTGGGTHGHIWMDITGSWEA